MSIITDHKLSWFSQPLAWVTIAMALTITFMKGEALWGVIKSMQTNVDDRVRLDQTYHEGNL
jgi:hypothetical protein